MPGGRKVIVRAIGKPAPQGSKRYVGNGQMVESSPDLWPWRNAVTMAAAQKMEGQLPLEGPVAVVVTFQFARPKNHYGTGKNAGQLRASAPKMHSGAPDIDKLQRSTFDGLTDARVWGDDAQVASVSAEKEFAEIGERPGALILIVEMES